MFFDSYNRTPQYDSYGNAIIKQEPGTNPGSAGGPGSVGNNNGPGTPGGGGGGGNGGEFHAGNPLAHLSDSVNSLDPLNAMEKSLNDQVSIVCLHSLARLATEYNVPLGVLLLQMPHTPHTPHTPGGGNSSGHPMTPGGPPSVPPANDINNTSNPQQQSTGSNSGGNANGQPNGGSSSSVNGNMSHSPGHAGHGNSMQQLHSPQQQQQQHLGLGPNNPAANIMNSPQSLMNSPQNMMNSPQSMMQQQQQQQQQNLLSMGSMMGQQQQQQSHQNALAGLTDVDLPADLNFDPAAVIEGEGGNDLNVSNLTLSRCEVCPETGD